MQTITHSDPQIIEAVIRQSDICFIGVADFNNTPYVLPMNFGYLNNTLYLHSAPHGRVIDILNQNNQICISFSIDHQLAFQHPKVACSYRMKAKSVVAFGRVQFIDDLNEKRQALNIIMGQYIDREFSYNDPAVRNVKIWKVPIESVTCKEFGAPHDQYKIQRGIEALVNHKKQPNDQ
ncbi:hypothetical protein LX69_01731 [Breznakibacter xylanolyticus]|uniref:Nitroimidazol reductase NimA-like FMN-containing flavoprotein (Pyridoxamine 5'-phosphate oxidase superfamily) n=1 Tax=Breznakibacter xylanolyticus TaxID=990 RepID=A0A2W7N8Z4_9BACT|nr:pyridoxamine 5'-phosphate oxidase family protein [Breznakibacter xylanolyticus]PZX16661.1 hypothetical protein LX69_01731 [Breznakibacter xylanolyticus]